MLKKIRFLLRLRDATQNFLDTVFVLQQLLQEFQALGYADEDPIDATVLASDEAKQYSMAYLTPKDIENMLMTIQALNALVSTDHAKHAYRMTMK